MMQEPTKPSFRIRAIDVMVVLAIVGYAAYAGLTRPPRPQVDRVDFAHQVKLDALNGIAVQADGRLRSFESHAKSFMDYVSGPRAINDQSHGFTYLDLIFRPERYADADILYVKNKNVRASILDVLRKHGAIEGPRAAAIQSSGLFSRALLNHTQVAALLQRLGQDLIRTSKQVDAIRSALAVSDARLLLDNLRVVAPPDGTPNAPWVSIAALSAASAPRDDVHAGLTTAPTIEGLDPAFQTNITNDWIALQAAWQTGDAAAVNESIGRLAAAFPTISPQLYPAAKRLAMESWYFRSKSMTWVWLIYLASVAFLLMSVIYKWNGARTVGLGVFIIAMTLHTASILIRWYISGRWPNANMFEAVTTAAWFGGVGAVILEWIVRRTAFRNVFALGSAVMSMFALMAAYYLPAELDSTIRNKMAALNDVWLYIHTNMIIWGYAVIGLACVPALLLLRDRWCTLWDERQVPRFRLLLLPIAATVLNYTAYRLLMHTLDDPARELNFNQFLATTGAFWGSLTLIALELNAAHARRKASGKVERGAPGGAGALILTRDLHDEPQPGAAAATFLTPAKPTASQVFDGATMVLVEISFIMLWAGIVMGAIWADHSWGRPWGWDPKEVFALNTFIIFLVLIHIRLKVRDKAFWTAVLAIVGFEVMMFNWIVVNFVITGLHSYA